MNHDPSTPLTTAPVDTPGLTPASEFAAVPSQGLMQQRRALQDEVEALRRVGALPSAAAAGQPGSQVSWNNWSNG